MCCTAGGRRGRQACTSPCAPPCTSPFQLHAPGSHITFSLLASTVLLPGYHGHAGGVHAAATLRGQAVAPNLSLSLSSPQSILRPLLLIPNIGLHHAPPGNNGEAQQLAGAIPPGFACDRFPRCDRDAWIELHGGRGRSDGHRKLTPAVTQPDASAAHRRLPPMRRAFYAAQVRVRASRTGPAGQGLRCRRRCCRRPAVAPPPDRCCPAFPRAPPQAACDGHCSYCNNGKCEYCKDNSRLTADGRCAPCSDDFCRWVGGAPRRARRRRPGVQELAGGHPGVAACALL